MNEEFSINQNDYEIKEQIGIGSSSKVYYAIYTKHSTTSTYNSNPNPNSSNPKEVSIKKIDLEKFQRNQIEELRRELLIMTLSKHENLLMIYTSFVYMNFLYIVTPYCQYGSMLDLMKYQYSQGFDENVCLCVLKQCLLGLEYLHKNSYIHRDVKSGNLLVERDGTVLLADFGVSSSLYDSEYYVTATTTTTAVEKKQLKRNTFVGTPCWIAPEVVQQIGYDQKADVWSFGITCLELTQGKAPFSKLPPMKVLLMTLQNDPPTLAQNDPNTNKKFSRHFKDVVDSCLQKDPSKRPTVEKLLQNSLFKNAKKKNYLYEQVLVHVPSVRERVQQLLVKEKEKDHKEGGGGGGGGGIVGDRKIMGKSFFKDKHHQQQQDEEEEEDSTAAHDSKDMIASWDFGVEGSVPTFNDDDLLLESPKSSSNDDLSQQGKKKGRFVVVGEEKQQDEHEHGLQYQHPPPSSSSTTTTTTTTAQAAAFSPYSEDRSRSGSIVKENQKDAIGLGLNTAAVTASSEVRKGRFVVGNNNAGILSAGGGGGGGETSSSAPASANIPQQQQQQQQPLLEEHIQTGSAMQSPAISLVDKLKSLVSADAKDSSTTTTSNAATGNAPPLSSNSTTVTEAATRRGRFEVMSQQTSPTDNDASNTTTNTTASTATTSAAANTGTTAVALSNQQQQQLLLISPTLRPERKDTAIKSISLPVSTYSSGGGGGGGGGSSTTATTTAAAAAAVSASRAITDDLQNVLSMCEQQTRIITDLVQKMKASDYYVRKLEEDNLNLREENERLKQRLLMK